MLRGRIDAAKWSEGKAMMGSVSTAIRAYHAEKGPTGTAPTTLVVGNTGLGFAAGDLTGNYFADADFTFAVTAMDPLTFTVTSSDTLIRDCRFSSIPRTKVSSVSSADTTGESASIIKTLNSNN